MRAIEIQMQGVKADHVTEPLIWLREIAYQLANEPVRRVEW